MSESHTPVPVIRSHHTDLTLLGSKKNDGKRGKADSSATCRTASRELLLECAKHFPGLEIWITGGWVRDRLFGIPSSDLDFALSAATGREFGKFLEEFTAKPEIESKYGRKAVELGIPDSHFSKFHIMERNSGQYRGAIVSPWMVLF